LTFSEDFATLSDREMVIEAVAEDENLKIDVFQMLDAVVKDPRRFWPRIPPRSRLSSSPWRPSARASHRHALFNPVPVLRLVEVISSLLTSAETTDRVHVYASESLNKRVISSKDRAGFVVNAY